MNKLSLYIHIPFCEKKCKYCDFTSFCAGEQEKNKYIDRLVCEIENSNFCGIVDTIYFGGGTPSLLSIEQLERIFVAIRKKFVVNDGAEITIEINPNSVTPQKVEGYKRLGINRVSIGVQSLSDKSLQNIGRLHNSKQAEECINLVAKHFDNISADLIIGLQDEIDVCGYAERLIALGVKHISCYMLEVHKGTALEREIAEGDYKPLEDEKVVDVYDKLARFLAMRGFNRYVISNFAVPRFESRHNIAYWTFKDYVGFGVSAHSYYRGQRFANSSNLAEYYDGKVLVESENNDRKIIEKIMLGLRCFSGVDTMELSALGYEIEKSQSFNDFVRDGILVVNNGKVFLNQDYYRVSDYIIEHLLP